MIMNGEEQNVPGHVQSRPPTLNHIPESDYLPSHSSSDGETSPSTPNQPKEGSLWEEQLSNRPLGNSSDRAISARSDKAHARPGSSAGSSTSTFTSMGSKSKLIEKWDEARRPATVFELSTFLYSVHKNVRTLPSTPLITELGPELVVALNDAANFEKFKDPQLLSYAADIMARFSVEPRAAAVLAEKDHLSVLEGVLKTNIPSPSSEDVQAIILEAWCDAAHALRNIAEVSEGTARAVARKPGLVKLIILRVEYSRPGPSPHIHHCIAILANIAGHGNIFKQYIHKHGGLSAVASHARQNNPPKVRFQSLRFLTEFSSSPKLIPDIIFESVIVSALTAISSEKSVEIASEAATFIGNLASDGVSRDEIVKEQGVIIITNRLQKWGRSLPETLVLDFKYSPDDGNLPLELLRAVGNLCYENERAARTAVDGIALMAFISGYDENASGTLDADMRKKLKEEALRGILTVARAGDNFTIETVRQIGNRIRQHSALGRPNNSLFDLLEKMKDATSEEEKVPQTTEELGRASENYALDLAYESEANKPLFSEGVRDNNQARPLLRVKRPDTPSPDFIPQAQVLRKRGADAAGSARSHLFSDANQILQNMNKRVANLSQTSTSSSNSNDSSRGSSTPNDSEYRTPPHSPSRSARHRRTRVSGPGLGRASKSAGRRRPGAAASAADTLDEMEDDHYGIGPVLGRGAFSTVHLAKNLLTEELVAVKRLLPPVGDTREDRRKSELAARKVVKEQQITRKLQHKNVVSYRGCFFGELGELNLIADYVPGWSLSDHLIQTGKFPEHMVARITRQIVDGLEYLHGEGVVHRDLKPSNLLVSPAGLIKIADFGVSSAQDVQSITQGTVGGAWYVTPEMILDEPYGKSVDIWALGCIAYELACGRRPYYNLEHVRAMIQLAREKQPPIPSGFSYKLAKFIKQCWKWEPEKRPRAAEVRELDFLKYITDPKLKDMKNKSRPLVV